MNPSSGESPFRILPLKSPFPGKIFYLPETTSTMDLSRQAVRDAHPAAPPAGTVFMAGSQTQGRGRLARRVWEARRDSSLLFTLLLPRPAFLPLAGEDGGEGDSLLSLFPLIAGLALSQALERGGLKPRIKWPNDLYLGERKAGGILCETQGSCLAAGVGLNCLQESWPPNLAGKAVSLYQFTGRPWSPGEVLEDFLACLAGLLGILSHGEEAGILAAIEDRLLGRGRAVFWRPHPGEAEEVAGVLEGLGEKGRLRLRDTGGRIIEVVSGEVVFPGFSTLTN
ncbi:MAG: biotin--[acetyl-CoA-carboxylase] ligase [Spirochaetales bacterium]|jgi:BirA family biotin operon repressor/biotin-[acetyl-CoA-carboxylase] ligase|nr:biotin--[acetyl-CoA-carboxylase] ligase [Spirochaetales bacterium]